MRISKILLALALTLTLSCASGVASADRSGRGGPCPPPPLHMPGLSGICADQQHLYVMAGGKIMQYGLADLKLVKTVDLPEPPSPPSVPSGGPGPHQYPHFGPPMAGGPHGLWPGDHVLYVLAGPMIYRYSTPDLVLQTTVELPKPELPKAGN